MKQSKGTSQFCLSTHKSKVTEPPKKYQTASLGPNEPLLLLYNCSSILTQVSPSCRSGLLRYANHRLAPTFWQHPIHSIYPPLLRPSPKAPSQTPNPVIGRFQHPPTKTSTVPHSVCPLWMQSIITQLIHLRCFPGGLCWRALTVSVWCWMLFLSWFYSTFLVSYPSH